MRNVMNNILEHNRKLLAPISSAGFNDTTVNEDGKQYREWEAARSKLAAAMAKGARIQIQPNSKVIYLGAAHGYTVSFLSQVCDSGRIYAVEFAPRVARELVILSERAGNVFPIIADAGQPQGYAHMIEAADLVYQDIAQRNQVETFLKNCQMFLKKGGTAMLALKARSIDVTKKPSEVFAEAKNQLEQHFKILDYRNLAPMQKDHAFFICAKR